MKQVLGSLYHILLFLSENRSDLFTQILVSLFRESKKKLRTACVHVSPGVVGWPVLSPAVERSAGTRSVGRSPYIMAGRGLCRAMHGRPRLLPSNAEQMSQKSRSLHSSGFCHDKLYLIMRSFAQGT